MIDDSNRAYFRTSKAIKKIFKKQKVGVLHDSNEYGTGLKNFMLKVSKEKGEIEIVASESYQKGDVELKPHLIKIRNKGAEVLYIAGSVPTPAIALRNYKELGMNIPVIGAGGTASAAVIKLAGQAIEGFYAIARLNYGNPSPEEKEVFEAVRKTYNIEPSNFHANGWDSLLLFARAMEVAGGSPEGIRGALENMKGFKSVLGERNMSSTDHCGLDEGAFAVVQVQKGAWHVILPKKWSKE